jgi:hypothetical protein
MRSLKDYSQQMYSPPMKHGRDAAAGLEGVTRTAPLRAAIVNMAKRNFFITISFKNSYY